jgi:predicted CXXCH cytochrome family protein
MKRYAIYIFLSLFVILICSLALAAPMKVQDSKHNLSTSGPNASFIATSETQICVFCHTPHSARSDAPLWNRTNSSESYTLYERSFSDVLAQVGDGTYPDAENPSTGVPHVKTRICLSCHDGTVALGSVVNMPGTGMAGVIDMAGDATIPQNAEGYIGTDLRDDHPVAIKHMPNKDDELQSIVAETKVRLYKDDGSGRAQKDNADGNYVECTSCHNPHDNEFGNFLVKSNTGSAICTTCHQKTGYTGSAHEGSGEPYSPGVAPNLLGTSVGTVKCMDCHFPHKAGIDNASAIPNGDYGRYLLSFKEEQTCYGNPDRWGNAAPCHATGFSKNIKQLLDSTINKHDVSANGTSLHRATEAQTSGWDTSISHVECEDCHNPHTAGTATQTQNPPVPKLVMLTLQALNSPLYGAGGAQVTVPLSWGGIGNYNYLRPVGVLNNTDTGANYEYEICFKCHSDHASTLPNSRALSNVSTNQAMEFSTSNNSFHPVMGPNTVNNVGALTPTWNTAVTNQTMYCSDCHSNNNAAGPKGPHGSTATLGSSVSGGILVANFTDDYATTKNISDNQPSNDLCFLCHDPQTYLSGANNYNLAGTGFNTSGSTNYNLHTRHREIASTSAFSQFAYRCVNCHTRIPHGYKNKAMIVIGTDGADATTYAASGGPKISSASLISPYGSAKTANCTTGGGLPNTGCHQ